MADELQQDEEDVFKFLKRDKKDKNKGADGGYDDKSLDSVDLPKKVEVEPGPPPEPKPPMSLFQDEDYHYKMESKRRGKVVVFNYQTFKNDALKPRNVSANDAENLISTFVYLGFDRNDVEQYDDLTTNQTRRVLSKIAKAEDSGEIDCIVVAVLSHGEADLGGDTIFYTHDGHLRVDEDLVQRFSGQHCHKSLAGKPKLFFIQACRVMPSKPVLYPFFQFDLSFYFRVGRKMQA